MNILVTARNGQIAFELQRTLAPLGQVIALDRGSTPALDLHDSGSLERAVEATRPAVIVNAAAYTAVDKAEQEADLASQANAVAPGVLARLARESGALFVHYSTDYVFDGRAESPYRETDPTGPINAYGRTKLAGEESVRAAAGRHLILRTAWVYGLHGHNFLKTMLRLMKERSLVKVVNDQFGAPTWSRLIAEATAQIVAQQLAATRNGSTPPSGTYHLTNAGRTSWFGFASAIRECAIQHGLLTAECAQLEPIPSSEYPTPAARPGFSVLDGTQLQRDFGIRLPDWSDALDLCLTGRFET